MFGINSGTEMDRLPSPWQPVDRKAFWEAWFEAPFIGFLVSLPLGFIVSILAERSFTGVVLIALSFAFILFGAIPYFLIGAPAAWIALRVSVLPWHRVFAAALAGAIATFVVTLGAAILARATNSSVLDIIANGGAYAAFYAPSWLAILAFRYNAITAHTVGKAPTPQAKGAYS